MDIWIIKLLSPYGNIDETEYARKYHIFMWIWIKLKSFFSTIVNIDVIKFRAERSTFIS